MIPKLWDSSALLGPFLYVQV